MSIEANYQDANNAQMNKTIISEYPIVYKISTVLLLLGDQLQKGMYGHLYPVIIVIKSV